MYRFNTRKTKNTRDGPGFLKKNGFIGLKSGSEFQTGYEFRICFFKNQFKKAFAEQSFNVRIAIDFFTKIFNIWLNLCYFHQTG